MRVLITGAAGFIGSHLADRCVQLGHSVRAFVRYNSRNSWGWIESSPLRNEMEIFVGDIRDFDSVARAVKDCEIVFHLAALIGIPYSYHSPLAYIKTNVEGTYNVLESCKGTGIQNVIVTSTSETYGTAKYVPIDEDHPAVGQSPYAATKIAADQLALSYHRSFGLPVKVVRPFNTYGPRQSARAVIPTIIGQILAGRTEIALGNTSPTRDLTYVSDCVEGFLAVHGEEKLVGQVTNVGMNDEISIANLADVIANLMGKQIQIVDSADRIRPTDSEVDRLRCNNTKLREATGWKAQYSLEQGLRATIKWFEENLHLYKATLYNV